GGGGREGNPARGAGGGRGEPQRRQKFGVKTRASGTLYDATRSSPRVKRPPSTAVTRFDACAEERARRQREQWQFRANRGFPTTTYATPPQRQLPRGAGPGGAGGGRSGWAGTSTPGRYASKRGRCSWMWDPGAREGT